MKKLLLALAAAPCIFGQSVPGWSVSAAGTSRNNFSGDIGVVFVVGGSDITVTDLGRYSVSTSTGTHTVKLVHADNASPPNCTTDIASASVTVNMSGSVAGNFVYTTLGSPVTLTAGANYCLVSSETSSGDFWSDAAGTSLPATNTGDVLVVSGGVYNAGAGWNNSAYGNGTGYVFTNFKYLAGTSGPVVSNLHVDTEALDPTATGISSTSLRLFFDVASTYDDLGILANNSGSCASGSGTTQYGNELGTSSGGPRKFLHGMAWVLSGLTPSTAYHFCVRAHDGSGWSAYTEIAYTTIAGSTAVTPTAPAIVPITFAAQGGSTLAVPAGDCANVSTGLQARVNAAAYGDIITIPAGTVCTTPIVFPTPAGTKSFTASGVTTSTGNIHILSHGLSVNDKVRFGSTACLPGSDVWYINVEGNSHNCLNAGGLLRGKDYYVITAPTANDFTVSATLGGPVQDMGYITTAVAIASPTSTITITGDWRTPLGFEDDPTHPIQFVSTGTLPGGLTADTDYYPLTACTTSSTQTCTFQVSLTNAGSAVSLSSTGTGTLKVVTRGTGTHYVMKWPPTQQFIEVRTATADSAFTPPGVRTSSAWVSKMPSVKQAAYGNTAPYMFSFSPLAYGWHFVGIEFTAVPTGLASTQTDVPGASNYIQVNDDNYNIIFDRVYLHGLGAPERAGSTLVNWNGANSGFINSAIEKMDYWHAALSGYNPTFTTTTATLSSGAVGYTTCRPTTSGNTVLTVSNGGGVTGTGYYYWSPNCSLTIDIPTGVTASCATTGITCTVTHEASPAVPTSGGYFVGIYFGHVSFASGNISDFGIYDIFDQSRSDASEGSQGFTGGFGPGPFILDNNSISGTGILVHADDSGGPFLFRGDYYYHRNTFTVPFTQQCGGTLTDGLCYGHRQPIEWKSGLRIKIDGNLFDGSFQEDTPTSPFIALTARAGGWISDVTITNNWFQHGPLIMEGCTTIDHTYPASRPCQRQLFSNNFITDLNGYKYLTTDRLHGNPNAPGRFAIIAGAGSDFQWLHNTEADAPRGSNPEVFHQQVYVRSNEAVKNNILWASQSYLYMLTPEYNDFGTAPCAWLGGSTDWDCWLPNSTTSKNVIVPSYTDTATPAGQIDPSTICTNYGGTYTSSCAGGKFPQLAAGATVADRLASINFLGSKLRGLLAYSSPYTHIATDAKDVGVDYLALQQALGNIQLNGYTSTATTATINAYVPDVYASAAVGSCRVAYGTTSDPTTWTQGTADTTVSRTRAFSISGLTKGTLYQGEIWCSGTHPLSITFSTI